PGDEIRISTLIFTFGDDGIDQIVVGGSAVYPAQGPTLAVGSVTTRPILGGSGRFAGVKGSAISEHLEDGTWRHTLDIQAALVVRRAVPAPMIDPMGRQDKRRAHGWHDEADGPGFARAAEIVGGLMKHLEERWAEGGESHGDGHDALTPGMSRSVRVH